MSAGQNHGHQRDGAHGLGGMDAELTDAQKRELMHRLRTPILTFVALMGLLALNSIVGWFQFFPGTWALNLGVLVMMIGVVLLFSMEVIKDPPLVRFFSVLGFCWVGILFAMVLIDYTTR